MGRSQIKIELVDHMGTDLSVVNSARVSFNKESYWNGFGNLPEKDKKLIEYLASHKHMTPFRHNAIEIRCKAPIFLARQLGKHQAGLSWNEVSRRYVDSEPEFYIPDEWRGRPDGSIKQGSGEIHTAENIYCGEICTGVNGAESDYSDAKYAYSEIVGFSMAIYQSMIESDVAPEMARMVLPQSMMTEWIWTGNLLAFSHVYKERINEGAQLEAQWFAEELDKIIRPLFPVAWNSLVGE